MTQFKPHISMPGALGFGGGLVIGPGPSVGKLALALWGVPPWYTEFDRDDEAFSVGLNGEPVEVPADVHTEAIDTGVREYLNYAGTNLIEADGLHIGSLDGITITGGAIVGLGDGNYCWTSDGAFQNLTFNGDADDLDPKTLSIIIKVDFGTAVLRWSADGDSLNYTKTDYDYAIIENSTPPSTLSKMRIRAIDDGMEICFRLHQMTSTDHKIPDIIASKDGPVTVNQPHLKLQASGAGAKTINGKTVQDIFNGAAGGSQILGLEDSDWINLVNATILEGLITFTLSSSLGVASQDTSSEFVSGDTIETDYTITENDSAIDLFLSSSGFTPSTLVDSSVGNHIRRDECTITNGKLRFATSTSTGALKIKVNSVKVIQPATGTTIHKTFKTSQVLQPDIPRTFAIGAGSPVINGDIIDFIDESSSVTDSAYWDTEKTNQVNVTVSGYSGTGDITLPFDGADETDAYGNDLNVAADGTYEYIYLPGTDLLQIQSDAGHTATVTVNFIKEVQTLLNTNTDVPIFYIDPTTGLLNLRDGTNTAVSASALADDTYYDKFWASWYVGQMHVTFEDTKGTVETFSGSFPDIGEFIKYTNSDVLHRVEHVYFESEPQYVVIVDGEELVFDGLDQNIEYI